MKDMFENLDEAELPVLIELAGRMIKARNPEALKDIRAAIKYIGETIPRDKTEESHLKIILIVLYSAIKD